MKIDRILENPGASAEALGEDAPVVISTRVRLARNLEKYPFPGWAKKSQKQDILSSCLNALGKLTEMENSDSLAIEDLEDLEKQILMERRLISRELMGCREGAGVCISQDQTLSVMVNEEDHLRIQLVRRGFQFQQLWEAVNSVDSKLEEDLDYAFSCDLGYLTACPTNVGTGLRCSAMMHLPGLVLSSQMEKVVRAVNQLGIAVRGLFGEGSDARGSLFQISNQQTLGESEEDIYARLRNVLTSLLEQEKNARLVLLEKERAKICDKIGRAYGVLLHSHILSSAETMKRLSLLRLAVDLGLLPSQFRRGVDQIMIESQPGHIQYSCGGKCAPQERDEHRAKFIREQLSTWPTLNFDKLK